jgi:hypothetical protein
MQLDLTDQETELLRAFLQDSLPDLRREVARTEDRAFRHQLVERQNLIERLLVQFASSTP